VREFQQLSLSKLLPTNDGVPRGLLMAVLKGYFDGGNKDDSSQYDVLSLACSCGFIDQWKPFETEWKKNLKKHHAKYLHTTDAVARRGIYDGWSERQRDAFLRDCVKIASKHGARAAIGGKPGRFGIYTFVVSIVLKDFVAARKTVPGIPRNANDSCLREAATDILLWSEDQAKCKECHFFFDRGEPFYGHLKHLLESKKARNDAFLLKKITDTTESNMRRVPALQLADLYAWCASHRSASWQPRWQVKLLSSHYRWILLDKTNLHDLALDSIARSQKWRIPRTRDTK
jgi:hypothetical protein